jgi:hypothetical protein
MRWSAGWAIGAWFVPVLSLVRPKAILNDIWRASDPRVSAGSSLSPEKPRFSMRSGGERGSSAHS